MDSPRLQNDDPTDSILSQLGLNDLPIEDPDDQVIWEPPVDTAGGGGAALGGGAAPVQAPPPLDYVPRAQYEELQRSFTEQMQGIQRQLGELTAGRLQQQPPSPLQPAYVPPGGNPFGYVPAAPGTGQPPYVDPRAALDQAFWQNPTGVSAQIAQAAAEQQRRQLETAQLQSNQVLAQTLISQLDATYAQQHPDLAPLVRNEMRDLIAKTPPAELAKLAMSGVLSAEYEKAFFEAVGKKLAPVYNKARQKRAQTQQSNEPPPIGGGSLGGRAPELPANARAAIVGAQAAKAASQPIRKSDLSADELQVYEWLQTPGGKSSGLTIQDIIAQRGNA